MIRIQIVLQECWLYFRLESCIVFDSLIRDVSNSSAYFIQLFAFVFVLELESNKMDHFRFSLIDSSG